MNTKSIYNRCINFTLWGWCGALFIILCQASSLAASSVTLAWDAVTDAALAGYKVYYGTASGSYSSTVSVSKTTTTATITGLQAGARYYCVVKANNTSGLESGPSNEINYLVPTTSTTTSTFANANAITIPNQGASTPYPSTINVSGLSGVVTKVKVTLQRLSHSRPGDVGVLLTGPANKKVVLMSQAGGNNTISSVTLTFDDAASQQLPRYGTLTSGTYQSTEWGTSKVYPSPAPAGPYVTSLANFNNISPTGTWSLYVVDSSSGQSGSIAGGWSLEITTAAAAALVPVSFENSMRLTRFANEIGDQTGQKPITITGIGVYADRQIGLTFQSEMNQHYLIEASSNHIHWQPLSQLIGNGDQGHFLDTDAPQHPYRFYRVIRLPE